MSIPAKETAASPRIRSLGERELTSEVRASTDVFENLEASVLLNAPLERAAIRRYRDDLSSFSAQPSSSPETGAERGPVSRG
ncbi:MAG: hypothetical protein AAFP78_07305 [Pseudomonadota bacterium]